jgi:hypothetical protein
MADTPRRRSSSRGEKRQRPTRPARAQSAQRKQAASAREARSERQRARPDEDPSLASAEEQDEETRSQADDVTDDEVGGAEEGGNESAADQDDAPDQEGSPEPRPRARRRQGQGSGVVRLVALARQQLEEVTGRPVSSVLGFEPNEDGWQVTLEVVELERIPDTTSILGCYRASLDRDGQLLEYRRLRRYNRSQPDEDY